MAGPARGTPWRQSGVSHCRRVILLPPHSPAQLTLCPADPFGIPPPNYGNTIPAEQGAAWGRALVPPGEALMSAAVLLVCAAARATGAGDARRRCQPPRARRRADGPAGAAAIPRLRSRSAVELPLPATAAGTGRQEEPRAEQPPPQEENRAEAEAAPTDPGVVQPARSGHLRLPGKLPLPRPLRRAEQRSSAGG